MGSKLIRSDWLKAGDYDALESHVRATLELVRSVRGKS
jgi:hypothetical protein